MNERERFLHAYQRFFTTYLERIRKMSETQALSGLRAMKAARNNYSQELAFLNSVSLKPTEDPGDEINQLKRQLNSPDRAGQNPFLMLDYIEEALKERLETLRKNRTTTAKCEAIRCDSVVEADSPG